ncbi:zinc finger Ran-binding domain-containing protein [Enterococcus rivorum]|uniref:RanBP2-type domain-containing protein n=1 Tax=Enterococcus rivorum TaxID=762845 RepID=A0A1E5KTC7_9ENTE|nr:Ran-binding zinc finger domain-containing protein [Enterococcus rivorum]MBP2100736.1 membrane protein implicated in regulation of membrane protease activity [Enterococcus rivorum]OEH81137.1 hypothetical protein BCR26_17400 [Enterococcus rivorum]
MGRKYVTHRKSGGGCATIFGIFMLIGLFVTYWPFFLLLALIALAVWYFKYYPKQKLRKQHLKEVKSIEEKERQLALEKRKLAVKNTESELQKQKIRMNKIDWKCSYCLNMNQAEVSECSSCGANKE